jgi:hypothetical protein
MAGWGRCRGCQQAIWWGTSPYDSSRAFPYDDEDEEQSHFETCAAQERATDDFGDRQRVSRCKACGGRVWWQTTARGRRRPMNVDEDYATDECHFDTCEARSEPEPQSSRQRRAPDPSVASAPYEVRLWLPDLGLRWPCTAAEVTSAFRRLALVHHPDMGGNASDFIRIKLAYDRLKQLLGERVAV